MTAADRQQQPPGRSRRALAGLGLVIGLVGALVTWSRWTGTAPPPRPPPAAAPSPAPPPAPPPPDLRVVSITGAVDAGLPDGAWRRLSPGASLQAAERIRTGPDASAELAAGAGSHLSVGERTELTVRELSALVHGFQLTRGLLGVDYQPEGGRRVRVEGAGAVAETTGARFHVAANGLAFAVASQEGSVDLSAGGARVTLGAGETSLSQAGAAPSPPRPIPTGLLLKIADASRLAPSAGCLDTTGQSEPGALVTVDGEPVPVGPDGRFPVRVGRRAAGGVKVVVLTPDGRVASRTLPCRAAPDARIKDFRVRWKRGEP